MNQVLKEKLNKGEPVFGIMLSELYVPNITRILAKCGYDFVLVDCEHGYFDLTAVANLIAVAESVQLPVLVRVTQASRTSITKYLDMGAQGIILSDTSGTEEARRLVEICKYAPEGDRGVSTFRAHTGYACGNIGEVMSHANDCMLVICQIESPGAVEDIDGILGVPGVDGVMIGPNDLSQHMGIFAQYKHPRIQEVLRVVADAAKKAGKWSGMITTNADLVQDCWNVGMRCYSIGSELNALYSGAARQLSNIKNMLQEEE